MIKDCRYKNHGKILDLTKQYSNQVRRKMELHCSFWNRAIGQYYILFYLQTIVALFCLSYNKGFVCRNGWIQERNKCYRVFNTTVTWEHARNNCKIVDGELLVLNDLTEQTFILHLRPITVDTNYWIGYHKYNQTWRWINKINTSINHLDISNITAGDDCASITKIGVWLPTNCEHKLPYLCTTRPLDCDVTSGYFIHRSQCLYVAIGYYDWYQARRTCLNLGADLATFPGYIYNQHELKQHLPHTPVWIGATYNNGLCAWVDGTIEATNAFNINSQQCGYLDVNTTIKHSLIGQSTCDLKMAALCEQRSPIHNNISGNNVLTTKHTNMNTTIDSLFNVQSTLYNDFQLHTCLLSTVSSAFFVDCIKLLFKRNNNICEFSNNLKPASSFNTTLWLDNDFYKELVYYVGHMIETNLTFTLCKQKRMEVFVVIEQILDVIIPLTLLKNTSLNIHAGRMEMGLHSRELIDTNIMYDSVNFGCVVTNVETSQNDTIKSEGIFVFVVINNEHSLQVSFSERRTSYYYFLVSSVLTVAGYDKYGIKIKAGTTFTIYYQDIANTIKHMNLNVTDTEIVCAYFDEDDKCWSDTGCITEDVGPFTVTCSSNHTTSFGIIMKVKIFETEPIHKITLSVITYIGCSISLVTLFIAVTIFTCIRSLNSERVFVHRNLCIAILAAQVVFIAGNKANQQPIVCRVAAVVLHYCFLSIFTWMLVEGLHLYTQVVQVFGTEKSRSTYYLCFGWGIPCCLVMISAVADWEGYGQDSNCWLSIDRHTIWAFIGPAVAVIVVNFIILVIVLRIVVTSAKNDKSGTSVQIRAAVKATLFLLHILGLTWIFGLLAVNRETIVFEYLFAICNSLQGFFVFLFHCILNTEVRQTLTRIRERHSIQRASSSSSSSSSSQSPVETVDESTEMAIHGTLRVRLEYVGDVKLYSHDSIGNKLNTPNGNKRKVNKVTTNTKQTGNFEPTKGKRNRTDKHSRSSSDLELVYM